MGMLNKWPKFLFIGLYFFASFNHIRLSVSAQSTPVASATTAVASATTATAGGNNVTLSPNVTTQNPSIKQTTAALAASATDITLTDNGTAGVTPSANTTAAAAGGTTAATGTNGTQTAAPPANGTQTTAPPTNGTQGTTGSNTTTAVSSGTKTTVAAAAASGTTAVSTNSSGRLCEPGDDRVGFDLGCDCKILRGGIKIADCSARTIRIGPKTIPLPNKLNVSSQVRILDLSSNELKTITKDTFNEVDGITELRLANNQLMSVDNLNFPHLGSLDLSHNNLTNLSRTAFDKLRKLRSLDLSHNSIYFIDLEAFSGLAYLQKLSLAYNTLENEKNYMEGYPFLLNNLTYLEELDLTNCSLPNLPEMALDGTNNLKKLIIKNNVLYYLPEGIFAHSSQLEYLDISGNYFTHLRADDFMGLSSLRTLIVDRTRGLKSIEAYAFAGLTSLQTLQCGKNFHLTEIDAMAFRGNPATNSSDCNPKVVQLGYNNLNHFEYPLLKWETLEELELYGNPWNCDCNLKWIADFIKGAPVNASIFIDTDFKCSTPELLKDTPLVELQPEELQCDSQVAVMAGVIAITIFTFMMILFVITLALYHFQLLPAWVENLLANIRTRSSLPKYQKVQPKPSGRRVHARLATGRHDPEIPPDLDWDSADVGHSNAGH